MMIFRVRDARQRVIDAVRAMEGLGTGEQEQELDSALMEYTLLQVDMGVRRIEGER